MPLDPHDPTPPYRQVANALRAAILTGTYTPGQKLPSYSELSAQFSVAKMTVQQALRVLRDEGLIMSRVGSGVYVRDRADQAVGLRPSVDAAFLHRQVSIDFAGLTAETLAGALSIPFESIRTGKYTPDTITMRLLLTDMNAPLPIPTRASRSKADNAAIRQRGALIARNSVDTISTALHQLRSLNLVARVDLQVRVVPIPAMFKIYLLNNDELFFGFYPVREREAVVDGKKTRIIDQIGKDTVLFHHNLTDPDRDNSAQHIEQARRWFDSLWTTLSTPYTP